MNTESHACPECQGPNLYSTTVYSGRGNGVSLLPGLGGFLHFATFNVVVCANCGLTRFYADKSALDKLSKAHQWRRL